MHNPCLRAANKAPLHSPLHLLVNVQLCTSFNIQYVIIHWRRKICSVHLPEVSQATTRVSGTLRILEKGKGASCRLHQFAPPPSPPHLLAPAFGHEPCNSKVGTICTCHLSAILHLPTTLGMWASTSSASSKTRGVRSPRPSCATCWKSHESLTYCQSLKSDSSLHLLASADASGIFAGSFDLIQMPPVSKLRPQLMLVCVDHLIRNNVANQPTKPINQPSPTTT